MEGDHSAASSPPPAESAEVGGEGWGVREQGRRNEPVPDLGEPSLIPPPPAQLQGPAEPLMSFPTRPTAPQPPPDAESFSAVAPEGFTFADAAPEPPPVHSGYGPAPGAAPAHMDLFENPGEQRAPSPPPAYEQHSPETFSFADAGPEIPTPTSAYGPASGAAPAHLDLFETTGAQAPPAPEHGWGPAPGEQPPAIDLFGPESAAAAAAPPPTFTVAPPPSGSAGPPIAYGPQYNPAPPGSWAVSAPPKQHDPFRLFAGIGAVCVLMLVGLFAFLSHSSPSPLPKVGATTGGISAANGAVTFAVPAGWQAVPPQPGALGPVASPGSVVTALAGPTVGGFRSSVTVADAGAAPTSTAALHDGVRTMEGDLKKRFAVTGVAESDTQLAGAPGVRVDVELTVAAVASHAVQVVVPHAGRLYVVTFVCPNAAYGAQKAALDQVVQSWKWTA